MKRFMVLLAGAAILAGTASAQRQVSTRQVCEQRCNDGLPDEDSPGMRPYNEKLAQIRQQKKAETDPDKRKALDRQEEDVLDKRADYVGKTCRYICATNPEG